ncbi:CD1375 family protein [Pseudobacillus sp. FSL P4-0506]
MAKLYYDLIKLNLRTIDAVPLTWRAATQALLDADQEDNTTQNT